MKKVKIYALLNPVNAEYFYIGQTINSLDRRLKEHLRSTNNRRKRYIINKIKEARNSPKIILLAKVDKGIADDIENAMILKYKDTVINIKRIKKGIG